jgi:protease I
MEQAMQLSGKRIAILATHGFEQSELEVPRDRLKAAGATVEIVSPEPGDIKGWEKKTGVVRSKSTRRSVR